MRILITGIHGFVGSNLVNSLSSDHTIYGLDIIAPEKDGIVNTFLWDNLEDGIIPDVDAIIHLAGKAHDTRNKADADEYFKVNTALTQKIYDYFIKSSADIFIFFSTAKAAADRVEGILTEDVVPSPLGPYGESKIKAEEYILSHKVTNKKVYILRPCMIHGPGNKGNLNLLYSVVKRGIPWPLGAFDNRRTFTSIGNICFAVEGLLIKDIPSGIYNMGDDEALSTNEVISIICEVLGRKAHIWKIPQRIMNSLAKIGGWLHLPLNPLRMQKLTENYVSSNQKIKSALQISRMPVDAREGLAFTISSFKNAMADKMLIHSK